MIIRKIIQHSNGFYIITPHEAFVPISLVHGPTTVQRNSIMMLTNDNSTFLNDIVSIIITITSHTLDCC